VQALNFEIAFRLACELTTAGHPRNDDALKATAKDLIELCRGATLDGLKWTPADQANWLVKEFRHTRNWEKGGTPELIELFQRKFYPPPELQPAHLDQSAAVRLCAVCADMGVKKVSEMRLDWCECAAGQQLRQDVPGYLDVCNSTLKKSFVFERMPPLRSRHSQKELKRILRRS
jgi:hypothetical protein